MALALPLVGLARRFRFVSAVAVEMRFHAVFNGMSGVAIIQEGEPMYEIFCRTKKAFCRGNFFRPLAKITFIPVGSLLKIIPMN